MNKKELEGKIKELEKNQMKLLESLPQIIINILLREGILHENINGEEISEEDILEIKARLNEGNGPKIKGTKDMNEEQFQDYYNQLKKLNSNLAKNKLKERNNG
tara:strand:- start:40 stop:351 length:312 start_codon:yes stop_codon:yes gene_type:complete